MYDDSSEMSVDSSQSDYERYHDKSLFELYKEQELCDLVLIATDDNTRISLHQPVLTATSGFFKAVLLERDELELPIENIKGDVLKTVVEFCYNNVVDINDENYEDLLQASSRFEITRLQEICIEFYEKNLSSGNWRKVYALAEGLKLINLMESAYNYALDNFLDLKEDEDFFQVGEEELRGLLKHDKINVGSEEDVVNALIEWIRFDADGRSTALMPLLDCIRFQFVRDSFLREEVLTAIESFGIPEAQPKVLELKERANSEQKSVARPSTTFDGLLMVTEDKVNGVAITKYHARRNNWTNEKQIPTKRQEGAAVIALNTKLIFVGGQDENCVAVNTVFSYDLETGEIEELPPMLIKRYYPAAAYFEGAIYVFGGQNRQNNEKRYLLSAERYDIQTEEWAPIAPMKRARLETACVVFERSICVIGGRNGGQYHKTVEQYSPDTNQWSFLRDMHQKDIALDMHRKRARDRDVLVPRKRINTGDMRQRRTNCGAGVFNKSIYVFGGFNGLGLNSIEKYDSQLQRWFKTELQMQHAYVGFGLAIVGDHAYIAGGVKTRNGNYKATDSFYKLNLNSGKVVPLCNLPEPNELFHLVPLQNK